jgi:hypothetical protein
VLVILIALDELPARGETGVVWPVVVVVGIGMFIGIVIVPVVVDPVVVVGSVEVVVVAWVPTLIVPVMNVCSSQWNVYVPGVLNVQLAVQPGACGVLGTGGVALLPPTMHELGCGPVPKSTLWML